MSAISEMLEHGSVDDRLAHRNALVLAVAQALGGASTVIVYSTASIVGAVIAPNKGLATLPLTAFVLGLWLGTLPVGALARRYGRRPALQIGALFGIASGLISYMAVIGAHFDWLLLGAFCTGLYAASMQSYRFAAADTASESYRPKVVSWVLAGGVLAAFIGPQLVIFTKDMLSPYIFAASYLGLSACAFTGLLVLSLVKVPPVARERGAAARPLSEIVRAPRYIVAVACGVASYAMMNLVMTAAPLAMVGCGHSVTDAALGIQWHVLGMYAPSFITGSLIARFGLKRITGIGLGLIALCAVVAITGLSVTHFWTALILLGVGWNLSFIGATTLVTQTYRPAERNKVQAFNDFLIFGSMGVSSFSSGQLLAYFGWATLNMVVFPIILAAGVMLLWLFMRDRAQAAAA
jgi:MFS family permease